MERGTAVHFRPGGTALAYLVLVSVIWGFSFVIIKGALADLDSGFISMARMLFSLALLLPFMRVSGIGKRDRMVFMWIGSIQFGLMYVAYIASFRYLPAHMIALLTTTTPLFVALIADGRRGRLRGGLVAAALLAVAGGAVMKFPDQALSASLYGVLLLQLSNAAFAFGQIAYRSRMRGRPEVRDRDAVGLMYCGAALVTGIFSAATTDWGNLRVGPGQWTALAYLGLVASGLGFFLWNLGARRVREGTLAVMNNLKIPVGIVASLVVLGETTDHARLGAGCFLFALALWANGTVRGCAGGEPGRRSG